MKHTKISISEYGKLCRNSDYSPNYHPAFIEYYFSRLGKKNNIVGVFDKHDNLIAAFPSILRQVFPNPIHKRLLGDKFNKTCYIGQPESLIPIDPTASMIRLNHFSPTTSPLLQSYIKKIGNHSLMSIAIAREGKHKRETRHQRVFFENGGTAVYTDNIDSHSFSDLFLELHCKRWGFNIKEFHFVRDQIISLYDHVFGIVLFMRDEPVASQLCYKSIGLNIFYVDMINSGVSIEKNTHYGNILMLGCLNRAQDDAEKYGKTLRCSLGYYYGDNTYKALWADPYPMFIAI
jgi:Mig-14